MSDETIPVRHVLAYYAAAFVDLHLSQLGCKVAVWTALHAPLVVIADIAAEAEKRFYFRGRDAKNTMKDCVRYLMGEDYEPSEEMPFQSADPSVSGITWNGVHYDTQEEYLAASNEWLEKRRSEILAEETRGVV